MPPTRLYATGSKKHPVITGTPDPCQHCRNPLEFAALLWRQQEDKAELRSFCPLATIIAAFIASRAALRRIGQAPPVLVP